MNNELEIKLSDEEMKKIRDVLVNEKGLRHYGFKRENGEYLDLVEYKDYKVIQNKWKRLRAYYQNKYEKSKNSTALYDKWTKYSSILNKMNEFDKGEM